MPAKKHTKNNKNERGAPPLGLAKSIYYCKVFFVGFCLVTEESRWRTAVFVSRSRWRKDLSTNQNGNRKVTWGHKEPVPRKTHSLLRTYNSIRRLWLEVLLKREKLKMQDKASTCVCSCQRCLIENWHYHLWSHRRPKPKMREVDWVCETWPLL